MNTLQLIPILMNIVNKFNIEQSYGVDGIVSLKQPTQQGVNNGGTFYFDHLDDDQYGWTEMRRKSEDGQIKKKYTQHMISRFQISLWKELMPGSTEMSAIDVMNDLQLRLSIPSSLQYFRDNGIGILRITDVRNGTMISDLDNYLRLPSMDIFFTLNKDIIDNVPILKYVTGDIYPVP